MRHTVTVLSMYDFLKFPVAEFSLLYNLTEPRIISITIQIEFADSQHFWFVIEE